MMNIMRTGLLMAALTAIFLVAGFLADEQAGMFIAFVLAAASNLFAYWNSDRLLLAMYGARAVDAESAPGLVRLVSRLSDAAGISLPRVYIVDNEQPNAFATGRSPEHAAVCVTSGLLRRVNDEELVGVLAHELGHVKNRDTLPMTLTAIIVSAISMFASFAFSFSGQGSNRNSFGLFGMLAAAITAPIAAILVQMAGSSAREFEADRAGAELSGHPLWLASALQRIDSGAIGNPTTDANPAAAFIVHPFLGGPSGFSGSHPATGERIARLQAMAAAMGPAPRPGSWA
jgi:heat shock protein HtpX